MTDKDYNRFRGIIGIAAKAGKVRSGEFQTEESVRKGRACAVFIAADASDNSRKHCMDMCSFRNIPVYVLDIGKDVLGAIIGRGPRTSVTIEDKGLADSAVRFIDGGNACDK